MSYGRAMADLTVGFTTAAPLDTVWSYFVEPGLLSRWRGHAERFEAWPSGHVRFADDGWDPVEGTVEVVVPHTRIEWVAPADSSRIVETFAAVDGHTEVQVQQIGLSPDWPGDGLAVRVRGWEESVADLVLILDHGVHAARHMSSRAELGLQTVEVPAGLRVERVSGSGPAARAGIRKGDVLLSVDRVPIYRKPDLSIVMRWHSAGDVAEVRVVRGREVRGVAVQLG